jgi:hypothetical protein
MSYYIIAIVYFVYCVLDNLMPVATHGHEPSGLLHAKLQTIKEIYLARFKYLGINYFFFFFVKTHFSK